MTQLHHHQSHDQGVCLHIFMFKAEDHSSAVCLGLVNPGRTNLPTGKK